MRRGERGEGSGRREEPAAAAIIAKPSLHPGAASLGKGKRRVRNGSGVRRCARGLSIIWASAGAGRLLMINASLHLGTSCVVSCGGLCKGGLRASVCTESYDIQDSRNEEEKRFVVIFGCLLGVNFNEPPSCAVLDGS